MSSRSWRGTWRNFDFTRRVLVVSAFCLFGAAAAVGMVAQQDRINLPIIHHIVQPLDLPATSLLPGARDTDAFFVREERIQRGDSIATVLNRLDVSDPALQRFLVQDASARSIGQLYPGRAVQVATDADGELRWMRYLHTPGNDSKEGVMQQYLDVQRTEEGFTATEQQVAAERQVRVALGTIRNSLYGATDAAGVPYDISKQMVDILATDVDLFRDLRSGDQFRVVYETFSSNGTHARSGRVLAMEFVNGGKPYASVWYEGVNGEDAGYYGLDGSSRRKAFLRVPLEFTRVSSGFGMRRHPVAGGWRGHKGVDYAAPTGTPIQTTGDGTIEFAGFQRGYGNVVIVRHHGDYSTLYAHMSRIAPNMSKGAKVSQGQLIGYVGSTGMSTGPHLHYEFRIAGQQIDPQSVEIPTARPMDASRLASFHDTVEPYRSQLHMLAQLQGLEVASDEPPVTLASR